MPSIKFYQAIFLAKQTLEKTPEVLTPFVNPFQAYVSLDTRTTQKEIQQLPARYYKARKNLSIGFQIHPARAFTNLKIKTSIKQRSLLRLRLEVNLTGGEDAGRGPRDGAKNVGLHDLRGAAVVRRQR